MKSAPLLISPPSVADDDMAAAQTGRAASSGVYVLRLNEPGRYYVGASSNIERRVREHETEQKVTWVAASGGVAQVLPPVTPREEPLMVWEMKETLARMIMHGFNNVRGWEYTTPWPLSDSDVDGIAKIMCGGLSVPLCRGCGYPGHVVSGCTTSSPADWFLSLMSCRTKRRGGTPASDFIVDLIEKSRTASSSAAGDAMQQMTKVETTPDTKGKGGVIGLGCSRCGRPCHRVDRCFARRTIGGALIPVVTTAADEQEEPSSSSLAKKEDEGMESS